MATRGRSSLPAEVCRVGAAGPPGARDDRPGITVFDNGWDD